MNESIKKMEIINKNKKSKYFPSKNGKIVNKASKYKKKKLLKEINSLW